ncbi:DNA double-strand break repair nuclease NurA [[Eubacterium] cellulosolvens]
MIHRTQITDASIEEISSSLHIEHGERALLPSFLVELSSRSMRQVNGRAFSPREISIFATAAEDEWAEPTSALVVGVPEDCRTIPLNPSTPSSVAAVDVSSLKIGETETGVLVAIRGAIVWRSDKGYQYVRCGPLTFHLRHGLDERSATGLSALGSSQMFTERAISRLRNVLERWIQKEICISFRDSIVLFDGSLTVGTPDNPTAYLARILESARERGNVVLAFSKNTKLCAFGRKITSLISRSAAPCLLDVDRAVTKQFKSYPVRLAGHVYVAKLVEDGFAFRLDVDRQVSHDKRVDATNRLIASDIIMQGYPETLRLAHIFSTFTANDVIGVQRYLAFAHGLRIAPRFNVKKSLFGPFGT